MGVINLGNLVSKLKNSLSGIFVKKTDKATASAFGIVKIGDNISVSSGKISVPLGTTEKPGVLQVGSGLSVTDGVVSAVSGGGITTYEIFHEAGTGSWIDVTLTSDFSEFKFANMSYESSGTYFGGNMIPIVSPSANDVFYLRAGSNVDLQLQYVSERSVKIVAPSGYTFRVILIK